MARDSSVGNLNAKVKLDTIEFDEGVKKLSSQFSKMEHQFKVASVGLDKVSDASKITALQANKLSVQVEIQKKIVDQYRQALEKAASQEGDNTKKVQQYELSLKKAEATLGALEKKLQATNESLNRHGISAAEAAKRFKELGISWESVGQKFTQIGQAMTVAITAPLIAAAGMGMKFNAQMEDFTANFETMLGSADAAKNMIADLTSFAKSTPFEMTGLADSAKVLLNFGVRSRDVMKDLQMLGDVSLGNQEKLGRLTTAFGQIQSTGRLMGQDLLQLINAGFNPLQVISEKTGRSMASLKDDMEKGAISADMVTDAFKIATSEGGMFYGAMEKGSKTFNGQMSTLKDTINITFGETLKPVFENLTKNVLPNIINSIEKLSAYFSSLNEEQKTNVLKWAAVAAASGPVLIIVGKLISSIPALSAGIKALNVAFAFLAGNPIVLGLAALAAGIGVIIYMSGKATREINAMTEALIASYQAEAKAQKVAIDAAHAVKIESLNSELIAVEDASKAKQAVYQKEYDDEIGLISKREQALKKGIQERQKLLDDNYKKSIDAIRKEYGVFEENQKTKTEIVQDNAESQKNIMEELLGMSKNLAEQEGKAYADTYKAIVEKARDIHDEKMRMYQAEYLQSVALINQDLGKKVSGFQTEIDELNKKTAEEERIAKEKDNADKIRDLQEKVNTAKSYSEYIAASKALADEITRQNREKELANRKIQIDSLNEQIRVATAKANEEKAAALKVLRTKTGEQQVVLDEATRKEIAQIQAIRIAKEKAATAKYNAAKSALDREEEALDGFAEREKARLLADLNNKIAVENAKLKAVQNRINNELKMEQQQATVEKSKVDETLAVKTAIAEIEKQIATIKGRSDVAAFGQIGVMASAKEVERLQAQITSIKRQAHLEGIPGFASGVTNWQGGLARVNENGGEIQYLQRGTSVIPNDISMEIARSIGASMGGSRSFDAQMLAENNSLLRQLIGLVQSGQRQPITLDGRSFGEAALPGLMGAATRQGKAWPVKA